MNEQHEVTPPRSHRAGRALGWVAVGAIGATALTGVAFAATRSESGTPSPSASSSTQAAPGATASPAPSATSSADPNARRGPGGRGHGGFLGGPRQNLLHGEIVVKDANGDPKTLLVQHGTVTAATSTSLTVKSSDGFVATWSLSASTQVRAFLAKGKAATVADLKTGDEVVVRGAKSTSTSGTADAVHVVPTAAQLAEARKNGLGPDHRGPRGGMPNPESTGSSAGLDGAPLDGADLV